MGMKALTVNVSESHLIAIQKLLGVLYPSRSEVIRCALRDLLREHIEIIKQDVMTRLIKDEFPVDDDSVIRVPITNKKDEVIGFKAYNLIKRLE